MLFGLALAVAGCGSGSSGAKDLSHAVDLAEVADLAQAADLAPVADLVAVPDLVVEPDMSMPPDLAVNGDAGFGKCPPGAGYGGIDMNGRMNCGYSGMCGGKSYTMDCDGTSCTCAIDKVITGKFLQLQACAGMMAMDNAWANGCGF